jgi:hypothetical protein
MAGGRPEGQYSEDEDTDTEEYKEAKARCVLQHTLQEFPHHIPPSPYFPPYPDPCNGWEGDGNG